MHGARRCVFLHSTAYKVSIVTAAHSSTAPRPNL